MDKTSSTTVVAPATITKPMAPKAGKPKVEKTKAKAKQFKASPAWAGKYREGTIDRQIAELIVAGKLSNDEIAKTVKTKHKSETNYRCVAWYRSQAKKFKK